MDVGFERAGYHVVFANELNRDAADTYAANWPDVMRHGDITDLLATVRRLRSIDLVFGGPPCQGFSVAGKMDPHDPRSKLLWTFLDVVEAIQPRAFVAENVKALGTLEKWSSVRAQFLERAEILGYSTAYAVLAANEFGVPQKRERVFFVGIRGAMLDSSLLHHALAPYRVAPPSLASVLRSLGRCGTEGNPSTCNAKITIASSPVLRKSPYAGMLFNGLGRPLDLNGVSSTLPASMGGNKTPIVDDALLWGETKHDWVKSYHEALCQGNPSLAFDATPKHLRRITLREAAKIQTFPDTHAFRGSKSSIYKQIGNAVPCALAERVARALGDILDGRSLRRDVKATQGALPFDSRPTLANTFERNASI